MKARGKGGMKDIKLGDFCHGYPHLEGVIAEYDNGTVDEQVVK